MKKIIITFVLGISSCLGILAQNQNYREELKNLGEISRLPLYRNGYIEQVSSYDRTGGNDDGFSGNFSVLRKESQGLVIAEFEGPGVINRIWTPTPKVDTIQFYFDGEKSPRINIPFIDLFSGKSAPFFEPLCGMEIGGYYCYLPIPYEKSLKIIYKGEKMQFFQIQNRKLATIEKMDTYSSDMFDHYKNELNEIKSTWSKQKSPLASYPNLKTKKINLTLRPDQPQNLIHLNHGGRIVGIEIGAGSDLLQANRKIMLSAKWDNEARNSIDLPLHDFFGFAFGKPAMQSMLLGADKKKLYAYLPMPFDESALLTLTYDQVKPEDPEEIQISGMVYYIDDKREKQKEGKLYLQSRREYNTPQATPYLIADIQGKGHYVGTILVAQGLENGHTLYFEGDDRSTIDGELRLHGTGSEDYFNGGYYAILDKWDRGISLPIHGSLEYDQMTSRTGGYRFYLSDKMNFDKSFNLTIEHQPEDSIHVKTDYTSIALFYAESPLFQNSEIRIDDQIHKIAHREKLIPQGMLTSLYWLATANYDDPGIIFSLKASDSWTTTVDAEAIPIVQISLPKLDNGRYKLYIKQGKAGDGKPFSIWQRSKQISDWIPTSVEQEDETVYIGVINITDDLKSFTIRKKLADDVTVKIQECYFEKIEE